MSEKKLKIIAVVLMVAALICLAIGTAFAVDFMEEHPEEFACDLKRPVVAANRPLVEPVVEPLNDYVIPSTDLENVPNVYDIERYEGDFSSVPSGLYLVSVFSNSDFSVYFELDGGAFSLYAVESEHDITSSVSLFTLLYTEYSSFTLTAEAGSFTLVLDTIDGLSFTVTGTSLSLYFRSSAFFGAFSDDYSSFSLFVTSFMFETVLSPVIDTLVSGLRSIGANVGRAFSTMANAIFINADGTGLSTFGILVVVFAAVSLGLSLTRFALNFCSSWGKRNR